MDLEEQARKAINDYFEKHRRGELLAAHQDIRDTPPERLPFLEKPMEVSDVPEGAEIRISSPIGYRPVRPRNIGYRGTFEPAIQSGDILDVVWSEVGNHLVCRESAVITDAVRKDAAFEKKFDQVPTREQILDIVHEIQRQRIWPSVILISADLPGIIKRRDDIFDPGTSLVGPAGKIGQIAMIDTYFCNTLNQCDVLIYDAGHVMEVRQPLEIHMNPRELNVDCLCICGKTRPNIAGCLVRKESG